MIVKIEEKDVKTKKGVKGWVGWIPRSGPRKASSKILCSAQAIVQLRPRQNEPDRLVALQERLEDAASAVKAPTTASRNRNRFSVPDDIKEMADDAATCRDPVRRKLLRKRARKARREFEAGRAVLPRGKVIHRPVVTKLWINGRASEDRDEWAEEMRAHCEKRYHDKTENSEVEAEERFVTKEIAVTAWPLSKASIYRSQLTGFSLHDGK